MASIDTICTPAAFSSAASSVIAGTVAGTVCRCDVRCFLPFAGGTVAALLLAGSAILRAQVPVEELSKPPADAQVWSILSTAGTHGKASIWVAPDGTRMCRESLLLRGQVWELDQSVKLGADGQRRRILVCIEEAFHIRGQRIGERAAMPVARQV